jgi:hypothetical protein
MVWGSSSIGVEQCHRWRKSQGAFCASLFFTIATMARTIPPNVVEMISVHEKSNHPRTASEQNIHDV